MKNDLRSLSTAGWLKIFANPYKQLLMSTPVESNSICHLDLIVEEMGKEMRARTF